MTDAMQSSPEKDVDAAQARRAAARKNRKRKGLVIVNTGDGKGKTTAALGVVFRAWGRGMKVAVFQFLKSEYARYGEVKAARKLDIEFIPMGDGWTWTSKDMEKTTAKALEGWARVQERIVSRDYDILVLDEFTYLLDFGWLDTEEVIAWLRANKPDDLHLIITGRRAPQALIDYADLVTEMREIKHPFKEQGIRAQPGIEY